MKTVCKINQCAGCKACVDVCKKEAISVEDALNKLQNEGYTDYLDLVVDDYEVEDVNYGSNPFKIDPVEE